MALNARGFGVIIPKGKAAWLGASVWIEFFFVSVVGALLCFVPGYLFARGLGFSKIISLCIGPVVSIAFYAALPIAYEYLGIPCSLLSVGLLVLALGAILYAVFGVVRKPKEPVLSLPALEPVQLRGKSLSFDAFALVCYFLPCLAIALVLYVGTLAVPNVVNCQFDNHTHLNLMRAFLDSGKWSTLHTSSFLASASNAQPYPPSNGIMYPAAWHCWGALCCLATNASVPVVTNALVFTIATTVVPTGMFLLVRALFPTKRRMILLGALATASFATWPWIYVVKGPRYPNMLGLALMVSVLAVVFLALESGALRKHPVRLAAFFALGFVALATAHPNTLYSAYVILAPYGAHWLLRTTKALPKVRRALLLGAYLAAIVLFWVFTYQVPFSQSILSYQWDEHTSVPKALVSALTLSSGLGVIQVVPALLSWAGLVLCLRKRRFWLVVPQLFFAFCFVVTRSGWDWAKYWFAGMWYQSPDRFGALMSVWGIPLAVIGLNALLEGVVWLTSRMASRKGAHYQPSHGQPSNLTRNATIVTIALLCLVNYGSLLLPFSKDSDSGLSYGRMRDAMQVVTGPNVDLVYGVEEMAFVEKVKEKIPEGALVLNQPNDGSMFAYGANELNTYFRSSKSDSHQTDAAKTIRMHLNELASNPNVQKAVQSTGAQYLLLLDKGVPLNEGTKRQWIAQYRSEQAWKKWTGINSVNDNTPGFTLVLSEGDDMRLYKMDV